MEMPIIVSNNGDAEIFASVEEVQDHLEPADVLDKQYIAYDCRGKILHLFVQSGKVLVQNADSEVSNVDELRRILVRYLSYVRIPIGWLNQATLEQLVEKRMAYEDQFNSSR